MKKVIIIYGALVLLILVIVVLRFRGINLLPNINIGGGNASVTVGNDTFNVEIADEAKEREQGLSNREELSEDTGMLFIFEEKGEYEFWMRDVNFPLDIIYISDNKIVDIMKNAKPQNTEIIYKPQAPANYVLEINGGLSDKLEIEIGDEISIDGL